MLFWGYTEFVVLQSSPNAVRFVHPSEIPSDQVAKHAIDIMFGHRAIVISGKGCIAIVKEQLKIARKYKREVTIKVHKM